MRPSETPLSALLKAFERPVKGLSKVFKRPFKGFILRLNVDRTKARLIEMNLEGRMRERAVLRLQAAARAKLVRKETNARLQKIADENRKKQLDIERAKEEVS